MASRPPNKPLPPLPIKKPVVPPKPQGLIGVIPHGGLESVAELGGGGMNPIWLATLKGGKIKIVLKLEKQFANEDGQMIRGIAKQNIKTMNMVMSQVSPSATMATASPGELNALGAFVGLPQSLKDALPQVKSGAKILLKLPHDSSFDSHANKDVIDTGAWNQMNDKERAHAKKFMEDLQGNKKAWSSLGEVIIVDALIGNNDRVDIQNGGVTNFGNLIFSRAKDGKLSHALGFDSVDPSAMLAKVMYGTNIIVWQQAFGHRIKEKVGFLKIADGVIKDLNKKRMVPLGLTPFSHAETAALAEGMVDGWDKLAKFISGEVKKGKGIASGLMARAKYLGWV